MDMKNFNIYLGAYASWVEANPNNGDNGTVKMRVTAGVTEIQIFLLIVGLLKRDRRSLLSDS